MLPYLEIKGEIHLIISIFPEKLVMKMKNETIHDFKKYINT